MLKIAVVDDDVYFIEEVMEVLQKSCEREKMVCQIERMSNARQVLHQLDVQKNFDVYILDIKMDYLNGIELAKKIREKSAEAEIVFLSAYEEYALQGYSSHAFAYLTKDNWKEKIGTVITEIGRKQLEQQSRYYRIQTEQRYDRIKLDDILYIEREGKNSLFYCRNGKTYYERISLNEVIKRLPSDEFFFVNRGQIINIKHVTHIDGETVIIDETITLYASGAKQNQIKKAMLECWRKSIR